MEEAARTHSKRNSLSATPPSGQMLRNHSKITQQMPPGAILVSCPGARPPTSTNSGQDRAHFGQHRPTSADVDQHSQSSGQNWLTFAGRRMPHYSPKGSWEQLFCNSGSCAQKPARRRVPFEHFRVLYRLLHHPLREYFLRDRLVFRMYIEVSSIGPPQTQGAPLLTIPSVRCAVGHHKL